MTDENPSPFPPFDSESWITQNRVFAALAQSVRPANKMALFNALAAAGIATITVEFDGYGDSGQIENIAIEGETTELPLTPVEIASISWGSSEISHQTLTTRDAVEALIYDLLEQTHCGWENSEGAYGEFVFNVAERTITLDYNERFASADYHQHVF